MFKKGEGNWTEYRRFGSMVEVDFHRCPTGRDDTWSPYWEKMGAVYHDALKALRHAYARGVQWVLFTHGHSTFRPGKTTSRSVVRGLMRSPEATPYIQRSECIQHASVFLAAIRPRPLRAAGTDLQTQGESILQYEWKQRCRQCLATGPSPTCGLCYGRGSVAEPVEEPVRQPARCPYCSGCEVTLTGETPSPTPAPCEHLVYAHTRTSECRWPGDRGSSGGEYWFHPECPASLQGEDNGDWLLDCALRGGRPLRDVLPPAVQYRVEHMTFVELASGKSAEGEGWYVCFRADGDAIFARNAVQFLTAAAATQKW